MKRGPAGSHGVGRPRRGVLLALTACVLASVAWPATAPKRNDGLRKLLKLPLLHAEFGLQLDVERGFVLSLAPAEAAADVARLKRELQTAPDDPARHLRLFELYRQAGDAAKGSNALATATSLYRRLAEAQSENAEILAGFGRALDLSGRDAEAEAVLRRAVKLRPKEWRAWSALSLHLLSKGWGALTREVAPSTRSPEQILAAAAKKQIQPARLEQAEQDLKAAEDCANRAVAVAPRESQVYADRALIVAHRAMLKAVRHVLQGEEVDAVRFYQAMFTTNALPDLDRMAALEPENPRLLAKAVLFRLIGAATSAGKEGLARFAGGELWPLLSETQRDALRRSLTVLENLGQNGNPTVASTALEYLGGFQWMAMRDRAGAEQNLRRAIALDAGRETAWDFLMAVLVDSERHEEALAAAETRLRARESARNHVAAAKACERLQRLDKAQTHMDAALRLGPDDYLANLAGAIIAMKRSGDETALKQAGMLIQRASRVEGRPATKAEWVEWTLTTGILFALAGDENLARQNLKRVLEMEPDNKTAREALALLGN
ncbi:MAG TPA: tetratricopeptide repeat protein [Candidatus Saccharimonadales bacterium]|nr:tetratricopeptide repeat protein [Candidatus Saccharimonadales bacterium]